MKLVHRLGESLTRAAALRTAVRTFGGAFPRTRLAPHVVLAAVRALAILSAALVSHAEGRAHSVAVGVPEARLAVVAPAMTLITGLIVAVKRAQPLAGVAPVSAHAPSPAVAFVIALAQRAAHGALPRAVNAPQPGETRVAVSAVL